MSKFMPKDPESLKDHVPWRITNVARLYRTCFDTTMRQLGLNRSQWWLIDHLCYFNGATQNELTLVMDIGKGGMGKLIDRLERDGLVRREIDPDDRRSRKVFLTDSGMQLAKTIDAESEQLVARSLSELSKSEVETLTGLLARIEKQLLD